MTAWNRACVRPGYATNVHPAQTEEAGVADFRDFPGEPVNVHENTRPCLLVP